MWNPYREPWWRAPPEQMFEAYYMTLRVHHSMPALEAYNYAKKNGDLLGLGLPGGFIGKMREALQGTLMR